MKVIVPIETSFVNGLDLFRHHKGADIGALAEALVYYDEVYANISTQNSFYSIIDWFRKDGMLDYLIYLLKMGALKFYHYDFYVNPIHDSRINAYHLINIQEDEDPHELFRKRFFKDLLIYIPQKKKRAEFEALVEENTIHVPASDFGKKVENAQGLLYDGQNYELLLGSIFRTLKETGFIPNVPNYEVSKSTRSDGNKQLNITLNLEEFGKVVGKDYHFGEHTPITIATTANRLLWSSTVEKSDLYLSNPAFDFLNTQIQYGMKGFSKVKYNLEKLRINADFPDIRLETNSGILSAKQVIKMRECAGEFREWFHAKTPKEQDILFAYLNDIKRKSGISPTISKIIRMSLIAGGGIASAAIGGAINGPVGGVVGGGVGALASSFVDDLLNSISEDWSPKFFGNQLQKITKPKK